MSEPLFKLEDKAIIMIAANHTDAMDVAFTEHVVVFYHIDDMDKFDDWGEQHGFNEDNTVAWLLPNGETHVNYLRLRTIIDNFKIPVVRKKVTSYSNLLHNTGSIN